MHCRSVSRATGRWALAALAWLILSVVFAPEVYLYFQARGEPISWLRAFTYVRQMLVV